MAILSLTCSSYNLTVFNINASFAFLNGHFILKSNSFQSRHSSQSPDMASYGSNYHFFPDDQMLYSDFHFDNSTSDSSFSNPTIPSTFQSNPDGIYRLTEPLSSDSGFINPAIIETQPSTIRNNFVDHLYDFSSFEDGIDPAWLSDAVPPIQHEENQLSPFHLDYHPEPQILQQQDFSQDFPAREGVLRNALATSTHSETAFDWTEAKRGRRGSLNVYHIANSEPINDTDSSLSGEGLDGMDDQESRSVFFF
jgi:hypothetical protein